ncbi:hypothetical protein ACEZCY_36790 [Streptacidiphilus sp. N1-12]|uniref:Uncharacterized protein n=2 Tax=Streptacidiphilus alkalitolerans TaxID=3342712 RepID=A0ABV6VMC2_9ACTN
MTTAPAAHTAPTAAKAPTAPPAARPGVGGYAALSPGTVLMRALLASGAALMAGLVLTYLVRQTLNANAFQDAGQVNEGFPNSGALSVGIIVATLLAVAVLYLLPRVTNYPFGFFALIMTLGYLAFLGVSFTSTLTDSQIAGQLLVCGLLAIVIAIVASWASGVPMDDRDRSAGAARR